MNKIIVVFQFSGVTAAQYEAIWNDIRESGNANPQGLLHHVGGPTPDGWFVCDVWESQQEFERFGETLMPLMMKHNIPQTPPQVMPVNYEYNSAEVLDTV
jgi:hypothetical protein